MKFFNRRKKSNRRTRREKGQAVLEYILLLTIVMGIMTVFLGKLVTGFDKTTARFGGQIEKQLRTGSAPATVWTK